MVGHSFGGYFPLFFPELEEELKGLIILNSVPTLNLSELERIALKMKLPSRSSTIENFLKNPNIETTKEMFMSAIPYCFPLNVEQGMRLVNQLYFNVETIYWWHTEGAKKYSTIEWIPEQLTTLIIGGGNDYLTPLSSFEQDLRFHRKNIEITNLKNAGHFPWIEQPNEIKKSFRKFIERLIPQE